MEGEGDNSCDGLTGQDREGSPPAPSEASAGKELVLYSAPGLPPCLDSCGEVRKPTASLSPVVVDFSWDANWAWSVTCSCCRIQSSHCL